MKRILYVGMNFHDYEPFIVKELQSQDCEVTHITDRPKWIRIFGRMIPSATRVMLTTRYLRSFTNRMEYNSYDILFVIVGRNLTVEFLKRFREKNPCAKMILYLWDDIKRVVNFELVRQYYDDIYSFDPIDCINNKDFKFLPLFYSDGFVPGSVHPQFDIYTVFAGTDYRISVANRVLDGSYKAKCFSAVGKVPFLKYVFHKKKRRNDVNKGMIIIPFGIKRKENILYMQESKTILDIPHPSQTGLTIRTFEALACKTKLITTNNSITHYDFYNKNNICVIDPQHPLIDTSFIETPYVEIDENIYKKYSLEHWVRTILQGETETYLTTGFSKDDL